MFKKPTAFVPSAVHDDRLPVLELVPPFATGKTPDTSAVNDTAPKVGAPAAFPCRTVVVVPAEVVASAVVVLA